MVKVLSLLLCLGLLSCQKEYNSEICDELSQMAYKGHPNQAREFKDHCQNIPITYTSEYCQRALSELMMGKSMKVLTELYGEHIGRCFTESDLARFLRPTLNDETK